jgi:hypothetical protein
MHRAAAARPLGFDGLPSQDPKGGRCGSIRVTHKLGRIIENQNSDFVTRDTVLTMFVTV